MYADDALNLNLIFAELTTNACKYAFNTTRQPTLEIKMTVSGDNAHFIFKDNGNRTETEHTSPGFGLFLIQQLVRQIQGTCQFRWDNGTLFEMTCKLRKTK